MEEQLKKALLDAVHSKISDLEQKRALLVKRGKNLDKLSELVSVLTVGFENLKDYPRSKLEEILSPYYASNVLNEELDKVEIVRFVFDVQEHGHDLELNQEEINVLNMDNYATQNIISCTTPTQTKKISYKNYAL